MYFFKVFHCIASELPALAVFHRFDLHRQKVCRHVDKQALYTIMIYFFLFRLLVFFLRQT